MRFLLFAAAAFAAILYGADTKTLRDAQGRVAGTVTAAPNGDKTYRDAKGAVIGTARKVGSTTVYRDRDGRVRATAVSHGNTDVLRDSRGRVIGTRNTTGSGDTKYGVYRNSAGQVTGTSAATRGETRVIFRDSKGRIVATGM